MPKIFTTLDKIKPAYDVTYKVVLFICKILLIVDILYFWQCFRCRYFHGTVFWKQR